MVIATPVPTLTGRYGIPVSTIRNWEQGLRKPEVAARVLLLVIDNNPEAVDRALSAVPDTKKVVPEGRSARARPNASKKKKKRAPLATRRVSM